MASSPSRRATAVAASTVSPMQETLVVGRMLLASTNVDSGWLSRSQKTTAALPRQTVAHSRVSRRNSLRIAGRACSSSVSG